MDICMLPNAEKEAVVVAADNVVTLVVIRVVVEGHELLVVL